MKKILSLFIALLFSYTAFAQVAFLKVEETLPDYGGQQPEQNAYEWFKTTYGDANVVDMNHIPADVSTHKVLWVHVDRNISEGDFDALFPEEKRTALSNFVKAGGNLLLTKKASRLICHIGRMQKNDNTPYFPSWNNSGYSNGADTWTINAILGQNLTKRDARQHPVFKDLTTTGEGNDQRYPLIGAVSRSDDNIMWNNVYRRDGNRADGNDDNIARLNEFQDSWGCQILAVWGHVTNYCAPTVIEFYPQDEFNGSIITIGAAAYQWSTSNNDYYIDNIKKLTQNALAYLNNSGVDYGYYMPYSLSEIYSIDQYQPEYLSAKWFYDHYIDPNRTMENNYGNGRFIHKEEAIPDGMKVLWVHGDRQGQGKEDFNTAFGGNDFKTKLQDFVQAGGNVFLSKQATHFANHIGRTNWEPSYDNNTYNGDPITWYMVSNFVAVGTGVDRHNHRAFQYMEDYTEHMKNETESEGYCKWPLVKTEVGNDQHSDHKYFWGEPSGTWGEHGYSQDEGPTKLARLTKFEGDYTARILGGWGHTTALDGAGMVEFLPTSTYKGTIIAQGLPAYQWTTTNTSISNVQNLTKGVLEYLHNADIYTRPVTANLYGTICLPRKMETISEGMTLFRVLSDVTDGIMLEQIDASATVAGEPYFFYSTASEIRVTMTGSAVLSPIGGNGLIGNFGPASITVTKNDDNYILAAPGGTTGLYFVDSDDVTIGANRAYLKRSAINTNDIGSAPGRTVRKMSIRSTPNTATGLEAPQEDTLQPIKKLVNGHLYIQYGDKVYDITGNQIQ